MTERFSRIGEHLKNAALYENPSARPAGQAWKRRLLARQGVGAIGLDGGWSAGMRGLLIILPLILLVLLMVLSVWNLYAPSVGDDDGPGGAIKLAMQLLGIQAPAINIWYLMIFGAGVTLITFLARGRIPNFLPLDW